MHAYRTLVIATIVAVSATSAMANSGKENQRIRAEIYHQTPAPEDEGLTTLGQGRASAAGAAAVTQHKTFKATHRPAMRAQ